MKIDRIETYTSEDATLSFVKVLCDDGSWGMGQIAPYNADISATVLHRQIARAYLGKNPDDYAILARRAVEANLKFPWSYVCRAVGGVDTAIWDLIGRQSGKSVCEVLGGTCRPLAVYGSSMSRAITPTEEAKRLSELKDRYGYSAFKIRVGKAAGHDEDQWPGRTDALVPEVRRAIGGDTRLLVDGNSCYTPSRAIDVGSMLQDHGVCHFEEPCPYWELEWSAQVAQALKLDVTGGEQDVDMAQWRRMIDMRAVDIVQPDICYIGGLSRALDVAEMAEKAGMKCVPHSANLSLVTVFSLHMMAAIPNAGRYIEYSIENTPWTENLFSPTLEVIDGKVNVPDGPGWGVEIDPGWLDRAVIHVSSLD